MKANLERDKMSNDQLFEMIAAAKAVEEGRLSIEQLVGSSNKEEVHRKLNEVTKAILSALEQAEGSDDPRLNDLLQEQAVSRIYHYL